MTNADSRRIVSEFYAELQRTKRDKIKRFLMAARKDRRARWKAEQFKLGNCIECGRPRQDSPYTKVCVICASKARYRSRERQGGNVWKPGKPGRPPLIEMKKRKRAKAKVR